jgi:UDP-glucose 4-epimerase
MNAKVVVTGGAGFIGSSLGRALLDEGYDVFVIDDFSTGKRSNLAGVKGSLYVIEGNILDGKTLDLVFEGADTVFHEAAIPSVFRSIDDPVKTNLVNVTGTLSVLEAARRNHVRRVIYAASSSAYGDPIVPTDETQPCAPHSPYAVSKLAGEHYCRAYSRCFDLETICLRYFNVFGPHQDPNVQYAAVIPKFITSALSGEPLVIYGDGEQSRDFCFIDNVVDANLLSMRAEIVERPSDGVPSFTFNVAGGQTMSLNQLVLMIAGLMKEHGVAGSPSVIRQPARAGDVRHSLASISWAQKQLGYTAKVTFEEGLRRTFKWHLSQPRGVGVTHE